MEAESGRILVDDIDIAHLELTELRKRISIIPQVRSDNVTLLNWVVQNICLVLLLGFYFLVLFAIWVDDFRKFALFTLVEFK